MNNAITENRYVQISSAGVCLEGVVSIPTGAKGLAVFVHATGSHHHSPRNQYVAHILQEGGLATLLFDLLTPEEELIDQHTHQIRFNMDLLVRRTIGALDWLETQEYAHDLQVGLFGSSIGAAAALMVAAKRPDTVDAVVSRSGRPDLAGLALPNVQAATLLIVGSEDEIVTSLNEEALAQIQSGAEKKLMVVPGASHLFDEPGTLEYAARLARDWFQEHLARVNAWQF